MARKETRQKVAFLHFTDFSFQISVASLNFTTSQEFKVKINCSKENEKETGREMTSFNILNKPILILIGKGGWFIISQMCWEANNETLVPFVVWLCELPSCNVWEWAEDPDSRPFLLWHKMSLICEAKIHPFKKKSKRRRASLYLFIWEWRKLCWLSGGLSEEVVYELNSKWLKESQHLKTTEQLMRQRAQSGQKIGVCLKHTKNYFVEGVTAIFPGLGILGRIYISESSRCSSVGYKLN